MQGVDHRLRRIARSMKTELLRNACTPFGNSYMTLDIFQKEMIAHFLSVFLNAFCGSLGNETLNHMMLNQSRVAVPMGIQTCT